MNEKFSKLFSEAAKASKSLAKTATKTIDAVANGKQIASSQQEAQRRLDICSECKALDRSFGRCIHCGCFVVAKVKLNFEECPIKKW